MTSLAVAVDASISGTVTDRAHAVVYNAPIVITNTKTGKTIETKTGRAGGFGPISLSGGAYKVEVKALCFKPYMKTAEVANGAVLHFDIALEVVHAKGCRTNELGVGQ